MVVKGCIRNPRGGGRENEDTQHLADRYVVNRDKGSLHGDKTRIDPASSTAATGVNAVFALIPDARVGRRDGETC